jgi:hypothetical protein
MHHKTPVTHNIPANDPKCPPAYQKQKIVIRDNFVEITKVPANIIPNNSEGYIVTI